jgi:glycosyltransferase involved in cell wall biosynthesis
MKVLFVVGCGIGNQVEALPAYVLAQKGYDEVVVCNSYPYSTEVTDLLFGQWIRREDVNPTDYDVQIVTMLGGDFPIEGIPVRLTPHGQMSEVEYNMRATGLAFTEADFSNTGGVFDDIEPMPDAPDFLIHDGWNKTSVECREKWEAKSYPRWGEVVEQLLREGYTIGSIGGNDEHVPGTVDMTGLSLRDSVAAIKGAKVLLANDTGSYHLANALGKPNAALFTFTDVNKNYDPRFHRTCRLVRRELDCSPCQPKGPNFWLYNRPKCKWECRNVSSEMVINEARSACGERHLFFGITTYNRLEFLKWTVISWDGTRRRDVRWTLAVADDGSTDGTVEWLRELEIDDVDIHIIENHRVGVHRQTNQLFALAKRVGFDFGFKVDDDIEFLQEGWDIAYEKAALESGRHHLVLFDRHWHNRHRTGVVSADVHEGPLHGQVPVVEAMGAFWTFTPEMVEKVGYFDEKHFGLCGWGHVDYTWRACRGGYNREDACLDLANSAGYVRLVQTNYRPAMPPQERVHQGNTLHQEAVKRKRARDSKRLYIPPPDMGEPGVTVVIPCYNHAKKLERSIGSVVAQTTPASIVVVDDGSPDEVESEIERLRAKWPDADIKLITQENKGLSGARNAGFEAAQTEWVIPLDADDELMPKFVENTLAVSDNADVVYTDVQSDKYGFAKMRFAASHEPNRNGIVCTCLIRRELWQKVGGYDESMKHGFEDWEFWLRCIKKAARFNKAGGGALFLYHDANPSMLNETHKREAELRAYMRSKHPELYGIPRLTVVIPCYNHAHYLDRCIASVLSQTERNVEIIVVDDGGDDDVQAAIAEAQKKTKRPIKLITQENKGLPGARNAGFDAAKAEWVLPLDADDQLGQPDYVAKCFEQARADVGVIFTDGLGVSGKRTVSEVNPARMRKENTMHACQMVRKHVWKTLSGYKLDFYKGYEDWEFWVNCLEHEVGFVKAEGVHLLIDDQHEGRMTPEIQKAETYWELLHMIEDLHPVFFGKEPSSEMTEVDGRQPGVTVILSCYNQCRTLEMALEALAHQEVKPVEVVVADDGSSDNTIKWLDECPQDRWPFPVRYVTRKHEWYRLASLNNKAASFAKGTRLLFTNADQVHCPTSIKEHAALPDDIVGAGIFKGIDVDHSEKVTIELVREFDKVYELGTSFPSSKTNVGYMASTDPNNNPIGVWGGNFSVPWETFGQLGGYDEGYDVGWGGEENDLVRRCVASGCRVQWVKGSVIYHLDHPIRHYAKTQLGSKRYAGR